MERKWVFSIVLGALLLGAFFFVFVNSRNEVKLKNEVIVPIEEEKPEESVRMLFVGDVMLSRAVKKKMEEKNDFGYPARKVSDFFENADVVVTNLEGPMSERGTNIGSKYSFRADPRSIETLRLIKVSVASLANNHMWDYGKEALMDTVMILQSNGILSVGAGINWQSASEMKVIETKGTKIGFLSYTNLYPKTLEAGSSTAGISSFELERVKNDIKRIKDEHNVDILVVLFHWGEEYELKSNAFQRETAHALVDAGADLIVGHHPHVSQDIEEYKDKWIFYSLGNFIFDQYFSAKTMKGLVVETFLKDGKISDVKVWQSFLNKEYEVEKIEMFVAEIE